MGWRMVPQGCLPSLRQRVIRGTRIALFALLPGLPLPVVADEVPALPPLTDPSRLGYAFDQPRILIQQRIFGITHGVSLLARACDEMKGTPEAARERVTEAYQAWRQRYTSRIVAAEEDLQHYYFAREGDGVWRQHVVAALKLPVRLEQAFGDLPAACATLPEALQRSRYDLDYQWQLAGDGIRLSLAVALRGSAARCIDRGQSPPYLREALDYWLRRNQALEESARAHLEWEALDADGTSLDGWYAAQRQAAFADGADNQFCAGLPRQITAGHFDLETAFEDRRP